MNRRHFLQLGVGWTGISCSASLGSRLDLNAQRESRADLVIIGGGFGGCAAALAACRAGLSVILTEETDWIGGQVTSQGVPPDEHPWIESFGCTSAYREYRNGVREYYRSHFPLTPEARQNAALNPGNGWVSRLCHEPRVSLAVLQQLLAPYVSSARLQILLEHRATRATVDRDRIIAVEIQSLRESMSRTLVAPLFVDATELGELLALSGTESVTGAESQNQTGEPHAPTMPQPENQQAFTCCFALEYLAGEDHTISKPEEYSYWRNYVPNLRPAWTGRLLDWQSPDPITLKPRSLVFDPTLLATGRNLWSYRRIVDTANFAPGTYRSGVCLVNWPQNDYWLGNLVGTSEQEKSRHIARAKQLSLSLLYWMQTEAPRPDGKAGWKGLRLRGDILGTTDGLAKVPYIRESRRIRAEFTVTEQHLSTEIRRKDTGKSMEDVSAETFPDSVGIGGYRIDLHPSSQGDNYIDLSSLPFQIPLGALLPRRMENLLPASKNIGTTHITNGAYRLHPVEWNIGEAVGNLAAFALEIGEPARQIRGNSKHLADFQQRLRKTGVELSWPRTRAL